MKLVFPAPTPADLTWLRTYYASVFADGAQRAARPYRKACDTIRRNPLIGHVLEDMERVRERSIPRIPCSFVYRILPAPASARDRPRMRVLWAAAFHRADPAPPNPGISQLSGP